MKAILTVLSLLIGAQAFAKTVACANQDHLVLFTADSAHSQEINQGQGFDMILGEKMKDQCASGCYHLTGFSVLRSPYPNVVGSSMNADQSSVAAVFASQGYAHSGALFSGGALVNDSGRDDTVTVGYSSNQNRAVLSFGDQEMHLFRSIRGNLTTRSQEQLNACAETEASIPLVRFHADRSDAMMSTLWQAVVDCKQTAQAANCFDQKTQALAALTNEQMLAADQQERAQYGEVEAVVQENAPADHLHAIMTLMKQMMLKM